jgi:hypothetical protein
MINQCNVPFYGVLLPVSAESSDAFGHGEAPQVTMYEQTEPCLHVNFSTSLIHENFRQNARNLHRVRPSNAKIYINLAHLSSRSPLPSSTIKETEARVGRLT